jgi:hypothetical protein
MQSIVGSSDSGVPIPQQQQQQQQSMLQLSFSVAQCAWLLRNGGATVVAAAAVDCRMSTGLQDEDRMICSSSDVRCSVDNPQTCRVDAALAVGR